MKALRNIAASALATALTLSGTAWAADARLDFSTASNPNGVWSYGTTTTQTGPFTAFSTAGSPNQIVPQSGSIAVWSNAGDPNAATAPWVGKTGAAGWSCCTSLALQGNLLVLNPGANQGYSVVRFTAAATSLYAVQAEFFGLDESFKFPNLSDVYVRTTINVFSDGVAGFQGVSQFNGDVFLNAGDTLDFMVGDNGDGVPNHATALSATVTAVPEPGALAMLLVGLAAVGGQVARRRARGLSSDMSTLHGPSR